MIRIMSTPHSAFRIPNSLVFALVFPSVVTWLYFVAFADQAASVQQSAYGIGKAIQFAFPAVWVFLIQRERWRWPASLARGISTGLVFGLVVAVAMWLLYQVWLKQSPSFAEPAAVIRSKIAATGFGSTASYIGLGVFYVVFHSLMEEYYWRWFVFRQLKAHTTLLAAVAISSLGFMAHHVILLASYFGWDSPLTWLLSGAVAIGGSVWAVLYEKTSTLLAPWFSHALVDSAIFTIGYDIVKDLLA
jgi:membrane protease YdiL (CAAX protease family)